MGPEEAVGLLISGVIAIGILGASSTEAPYREDED